MRGSAGWRPAQQRQAASRHVGLPGSTARGRAFRGFGRYARARLGRAALSVSDARRTLRASSAAGMSATDTAATRRAASTIGAITTGASLGMCPAMQRCAAGQGSAHARCGCGRGAGTCGVEAVVKSCGKCYSQGGYLGIGCCSVLPAVYGSPTSCPLLASCRQEGAKNSLRLRGAACPTEPVSY